MVVSHLSVCIHIALIADQNEQDVVVTNRLCVFNPFVDRLEGLEVGHFVADYGDGTVFDVARDERLEALLACGVPQVQNNHLVLHVHLLGHEVDADRRLVVVFKSLVNKTVNDARLPCILISEEDNLVLVLARTTRTLICLI